MRLATVFLQKRLMAATLCYEEAWRLRPIKAEDLQVLHSMILAVKVLGAPNLLCTWAGILFASCVLFSVRQDRRAAPCLGRDFRRRRTASHGQDTRPAWRSEDSSSHHSTEAGITEPRWFHYALRTKLRQFILSVFPCSRAEKLNRSLLYIIINPFAP